MTVQEILSNTKEQMAKTIEFTKAQLGKVRTGRATASLVDSVRVEYYGQRTPISQIAGISVPDAKTIVIQPWDRASLTAIEKAIQHADLGFNPQNDGNIIRIPVPPLTEERRKEFVKLSKKYTEDGKVAVRNVRRDQIEVLKKGEKDKSLTVDDRKWGETEIQKITDEFIRKVDEAFIQKEKELMDN
jgi:ribosome recycling factor